MNSSSEASEAGEREIGICLQWLKVRGLSGHVVMRF